MKPTHMRLKTKTKVIVERHEGNVLTVKNRRGKFLGSYGPERESLALFHKRYKSLHGKPANAV